MANVGRPSEIRIQWDAEVLRSRKDWFVNFGKPFTTLWYIPVGHLPTVEEAVDRLKFLQDHGPSPHAFEYKTKFPKPSDPAIN